MNGWLSHVARMDPVSSPTSASKAVCDEAVKFAEESPEPELSALYEDVLA